MGKSKTYHANFCFDKYIEDAELTEQQTVAVTTYWKMLVKSCYAY